MYQQTIIVRGVDGFWTGSTWSDEYPDALQFKSMKEAVRLADKLNALVIVDYGTVNQQIFD